MGARLSALIAAALTGLVGPALIPAAAAEVSTAPSNAAATSAETSAPTAAAGNTEAAQSGDNGPAEGPSHVQAANDQPTGGPVQEAGASSGATIDNNAAVDQSSGQAQDAGNAGSAQSAPAAQPNPSAQRDQQAHAGQKAEADADATAIKPKNDSKGVRVGEAGAGDGGSVGQSNGSGADAGASTSQSTTQEAGPGSGSAETTGDQSASADANAKADKPKNSIVNARVEAPGHDAGFDQSNKAEARAAAKTERKAEAEERKAEADERKAEAHERTGEDVGQEAKASANAALEQPTNTAVELRLFSEGDTAGGIQANTALAQAVVAGDGPNADAAATAEITDPTNTFVSLRVNSAGTTGEVAQQTLEEEIESVNGSSVTRVESDADDMTWTSVDPTSGLEIAFKADGDNTDLRIALDDASLPRPSDGTLFVWTWDMVFGPGGSLACAIESSAENGTIGWNFDCDPNDEIQRASGQASPAPVQGAISWTWSWLRPDLPQWVWDYTDVIPILTCSIGCTYVLDFRWLSYEPVRLAPRVMPAGQTTAAVQQHSIAQVNDSSATAVATATSDAVQMVSQTRDEGSASTQIVLQQLTVEQVASAQAVAVLSDAVNVSVDTAGVASQANRASAAAGAQIASAIVQQIAQHAAGADSYQTQVALQSTSTTQVLVSVSVATIVKSLNFGVSVGGTSTQTANSLASAVGVEATETRQRVEQEQDGNGADQEQIAGQWAVVAQELELLAGATLADTRNESTLIDEASSLRTESEATTSGSSAGTVDQVAIQLQSGDTTALQQESYQQATIAQAGIGLAAATAGGFKLVYRTPPPEETPAIGAPGTVTPFATIADGSPGTEAAPAEPVLLSLQLIDAGRVAAPGRAVLPKRAALRLAAPRASASDVQERTDAAQAPADQPRAAAPAPLAIPLANQVLASPAGLAGSVPSMTEDAESAAAGSSGPLCVAPGSGASAPTAGNGSGSAFCALSGYVLSPLPRLGRRLFEPAGRRPAADVLLRARPG